jgi:hypothetical protein
MIPADHRRRDRHPGGGAAIRPPIKDSWRLTADVSKSVALSKIALAQSEAGLNSQSAATFERAAQVAAAASTPNPRCGHSSNWVARKPRPDPSMRPPRRLTRRRRWRGHCQMARCAPPVCCMSSMPEPQLAWPSTPMTRRCNDHAIDPAKTRRAFLLRRVAQALEKKGLPQDAVAAYRAMSTSSRSSATPTSSRLACVNPISTGICLRF